MNKHTFSNGTVAFIRYHVDNDWFIGWEGGGGQIVRAESEEDVFRILENNIQESLKREQFVKNRRQELMQAFEHSGRKENFADPSEIDSLNLTLTEKRIMQHCKRAQCHGCKLGWICPKFWAE